MKTLNLHEAAVLLHMHAESLRQKTRQGLIPGAKIGKRWVFLEEDLIDYLRSQYPSQRQAARVTDTEVKSDLSLVGRKTISRRCDSELATDAEYAKLLGLPTSPKRRRTTGR